MPEINIPDDSKLKHKETLSYIISNADELNSLLNMMTVCLIDHWVWSQPILTTFCHYVTKCHVCCISDAQQHSIKQ